MSKTNEPDILARLRVSDPRRLNPDGSVSLDESMLNEAAGEIRRLRAALAVIRDDTSEDEPAHQIAKDALDGAPAPPSSEHPSESRWLDACEAIAAGEAPDRATCPAALWGIWEQLERFRKTPPAPIRDELRRITNAGAVQHAIEADRRVALLVETLHTLICQPETGHADDDCTN